MLTLATFCAERVIATTINFDTLPSGTAANAFAPSGWSFDFGMFAPDLDGFGDPIPGSAHWQVDPSFTVQAENPLNRNYGSAPSPDNALNGVDQTVLLSFSSPLSLHHFSVTLDNSIFGNLGIQSIDFYNTAHGLLFSLPVDETIKGYVATFDGQILGVSTVAFPNNAYYDNLAVKAPDSGNSAALLLIGLCGLRLMLPRCSGVRR